MVSGNVPPKHVSPEEPYHVDSRVLKLVEDARLHLVEIERPHVLLRGLDGEQQPPGVDLRPPAVRVLGDELDAMVIRAADGRDHGRIIQNVAAEQVADPVVQLVDVARRRDDARRAAEEGRDERGADGLHHVHGRGAHHVADAHAAELEELGHRRSEVVLCHKVSERHGEVLGDVCAREVEVARQDQVLVLLAHGQVRLQSREPLGRGRLDVGVVERCAGREVDVSRRQGGLRQCRRGHVHAFGDKVGRVLVCDPSLDADVEGISRDGVQVCLGVSALLTSIRLGSFVFEIFSRG